METLKIKVNLPSKVYDILVNDMSAFHYFKNDGSTNKNSFINDLIRNYYGYFSKREEDVISRVKSQIKVNESDFPLISSIFFEERFRKDGNYQRDLQFIIQKENVAIYEEITSLYLRNRSVSQFFREMFILYSSYPQNAREEILNKNKILLAKKIATNKHSSIVISPIGEKRNIDIYDVVPTTDGLYNYLLGVETKDNTRKVVSIHLFDIASIIENTKVESLISGEEKEKLDLTIYQAPMFPINKIEDIEVKLTDIGVRLYNLWTVNRPKAYKVEGNTYFFRGDFYHFVIYFYKFANEANIVSPKEVRDFIKSRYQIALDSYK